MAKKNDTKLTEENISELDKALAAAKAKRDKKGTVGTAEAAAAEAKPKVTKTLKSDEEKSLEKEAKAKARAEAKALKDKEREEKRLAREKEKAEKAKAREEAKEAREASRENKKPHVAKLQKAAEKLPTLSDTAKATLEAVLDAGLTELELSAVAAHVSHQVRVKATERALTVKLEAGQLVEIVSGDPRYVGSRGTVAKAQRIRCYVDVKGHEKPVYLFTSDVVPVTATDSCSEELETEDTAQAV